ncbi:Uncharacterised protein [uncultured archaeon]|nr:Uncharacterised protein [uncultured archaeon]
MDFVKGIIIILCVLIYWKLVYYKYHTKSITPFLFFFAGGASFFVGLWAVISNRINFQEILPIYYLVAGYMLFSFILVFVGISKKGLGKKVDITLTWAKKVFPIFPFYFWMLVAFPALFFIMLATLFFLGQEHIFFWAMVLLAWILSNYRLFKYIYS